VQTGTTAGSAVSAGDSGVTARMGLPTGEVRQLLRLILAAGVLSHAGDLPLAELITVEFPPAVPGSVGFGALVQQVAGSEHEQARVSTSSGSTGSQAADW